MPKPKPARKRNKERKAIRKRPMFMFACVFTAGTILAEQLFGAEESSAQESLPLWIFPAVLLLIAIAVSIRPLRLGHYFKTILWNLLIIVVFVAAILHGRKAIEFRQSYLTQLTEGETVTVCGRLDRKEYKNDRYRYYLTDTSVRIGQEAFQCNDIILYYDDDENAIGDTLLVTGEVYLYARATNEGMFDLRAYYQSQKIDFALFPADSRVVREAAFPWKEYLWKLQNRLEKALQEACDRMLFSSSDSGLVAAMLLGDKSSLEEEVKSLYQDAGISHILAISGLHISILGMSMYRFLRKRGAGFGLSGAMAGIFLVLYATMTGCAVSTERAAGMACLTMIGAVIGRQTDMLNSLGIMILFLLWSNPFLTGNSGFVFTIAAILGITVTGRVLTEGMEENRYNLAEEVRQEDEKLRKHVEEWWNENKIRRGQQSQEKREEDPGNNRESGRLLIRKDDLPLILRAFHVRKRKLLKSTLPESLLSGLAITITTLPIVARFYFQIPVYSFLLNLLVLPLTGILMISGVCGTLAAVFSPQIGALLLTPAAGILQIYTTACRGVLKLPGAQIITGEPALGRILIYYGLLGIGLIIFQEGNRREETEVPKRKAEAQKKKGKGRNAGTGIFTLILVTVLFVTLPRGFELDILDVGQGDGIFLRTEDGITCFWDGGSTSEEEVGTYRILPFLKSKAIRQIDYWFVTHSDTDHISGLKEILQEGYSIENLVLSAYMPEDTAREELETLALANHTQMLFLHPGDCIRTKSAVLTCLYPDEEAAEAFEDVNNLSLTMLYEEDGFSGIFAGDIPEEAEELLIEEMKEAQEEGREGLQEGQDGGTAGTLVNIYDRIQNITFYKVNHHGSKYSSSTAFMEVLSPDLAVISCGINNRYGHPAAEAIERIEDTGCRIFYTMYSGEIKLTRKKGEDRIRCRTFK